MIVTSLKNKIRTPERTQTGFSMLELMITLTITLIILGLAFTLLARSLNTNVRQQTQASVMADARLALSRMADDVTNAGFGLRTNGIVVADSNARTIRVHANLNALMKQSTSNTVTDSSEDVAFVLTPNPPSDATLVRKDVATGNASILAYNIDDSDIDNDGIGDGLSIAYLDSAGTAVTPDRAARVVVTLRAKFPQVGMPGAPGFQPAVTRVLTENMVLRNSNLPAY